jgi:excisionase family DNA binding protein
MGHTAQIQDHASQTLIEQIASRKSALTLRQFAEIFSISYKTAFEMATQGRIPAMRIGSNWRLDPASVAAWARQQQVTTIAHGSRPRVRSRRPQAKGSAAQTQDPSVPSTSSPFADPSPRAAIA